MTYKMDERDLKESIIQLQKSLSKIETALLGDEFRVEGLVKKVERIDVKVERHDTYFKVAIALFIVVGFVLGLLTDFIKIV